MKFRALSFVGIAALVLGGSSFPLAVAAENGAVAPKYKIRWLVAHGPFNLIKEATDHLAEVVKRESKGEMVVEVVVPKGGYEKGAMTPEEALKLLANGKYEMSQIYTTSIGELDHRFWVLDIPFLFKTHEHASRFLDGPLGEELMDELPKQGQNFRGLAFTYSGGYRIIPTKEKSIERVEDFEGLKLQTMGSPVAKATMELLKAQVVDIPKKDIPGAMANGTIDGFESTYTRFGGLKEEVAATKVVNETFHSLHLTSILVNEKFYQSLPAEMRAILKKAAAECAHIERGVSIREGERYRSKDLPQAGLKVVRMPERERLKMEQVTAPVAGQFPQYFSYQYVQKIRDLAK